MRYRPFFIIASLTLSLGGCTSSSRGFNQNSVQQTDQATKAIKNVDQQDHLSYRVLPFRIKASYDTLSRQLSPDGRYIAWFTEPKGNRERLIIHNFVTSKTSTFDIGRLKNDSSNVERYLAWRQDSQACAIVASSGIAIIWPADKKIRWISRHAPTFDSCIAWAPRSHQLAIFQGDYLSESYFQVWNGHKVVSRLDWQKAVGSSRTKYETSAMQAEWSPDEKSIALRFEGRSGISGTFSNPMGLAVLNAKTGRARWVWNSLAGPVRWLDNSRLVFQDFDDYTPKSLIVARPKTKQHGEWLGNVASWTLSAQHDTLWAVTNQGYLYKTPTLKRQWTLVERSVGEAELSISPRSDVVALSPWTDNPDQWHLSLFIPANGQIWRWQGSESKGEFQIIGWAKGQKFPLVAFQPNTKSYAGEPWQVWQFGASK